MRYSYRLLTSPPHPRSTTLDRVGAGFALAGGGGGGGEVKTTAKRAPVKSTWPDQSHSSSTRGYHRTSYLKWRTRRISPSLISTRRNFCIDVPPVSVYTGKAARRRRQGNFSDAHPSTWRAERGLNKESAYSETEHRRMHIYVYIYSVHQGKSRAPVSSTVFRARKYDSLADSSGDVSNVLPYIHRPLQRIWGINVAESKYRMFFGREFLGS